MGQYSAAEGDYALAAGDRSYAQGDGSIAMGITSIATGEGALASGVSSLARGANSTALSGGMVGPNGANSVAMGAGAEALVRDSVALGSRSVADREAGVAGWDPGSRGFSSRMDPAWRSTANAVSVGDAKNGVTRQITGVAAGSEDTDAVNVAQLKSIKNDWGRRLDRVGAGAAALAAIHPQDFDPADKWDFAAGYGHYRTAHAAALGVFYRPNAKTMFSIGGSIGGGENLLNVGVSLKFGKSSPYAGYSKAALTTVIADQKDKITLLESKVSKQDAENAALKAQVESQQKQIEEILNQLKTLKK